MEKIKCKVKFIKYVNGDSEVENSYWNDGGNIVL